MTEDRPFEDPAVTVRVSGRLDDLEFLGPNADVAMSITRSASGPTSVVRAGPGWMRRMEVWVSTGGAVAVPFDASGAERDATLCPPTATAVFLAGLTRYEGRFDAPPEVDADVIAFEGISDLIDEAMASEPGDGVAVLVVIAIRSERHTRFVRRDTGGSRWSADVVDQADAPVTLSTGSPARSVAALWACLGLGSTAVG